MTKWLLGVQGFLFLCGCDALWRPFLDPVPTQSCQSGDSSCVNGLALSTVIPSRGNPAGGTPLTLTGQNFMTGATVKVAGLSAQSVSVVSSGQIMATLPANMGAFGLVPVVVQNPDGQMVTRGDLFGYFATQVAFSTMTNFAVGTQPSAVVVADFNVDGKLDLAVTNEAAGTVSILLGNGTGSFLQQTIVAVGQSNSATKSLAVGDFNGDQALDLVVANFNDNNVVLLTGDGKGGFTKGSTFPVGAGPSSVATADFNGDHMPDLVVANKNDSSVSVLLATGSSNFGSETRFMTDQGPVSVAVGDFNGDRKFDLAVANYNSNTMSVLLGDGMGMFGAARKTTVGGGPNMLIVGDFGNQQTDVAVVNSGDSSVSVLLGDGSGGIGKPSTFDVLGQLPYSLAVGDFNGDQRLDLVTANKNSGTVSVLLGRDGSSFAPAILSSAGMGPSSVAVGDFNGDQKPDLAITNANSNNVTILINQSQ